MLRKISHIALLLIVGIYYNSVPIAWLAYSTFAERAFAEHCVNSPRSGCRGKCQVRAIEQNGEKAGHSQTPNLRIIQAEPSYLFSSIIPDAPSGRNRIACFVITLSLLHGTSKPLFHPPKFIA
ncbi:MAG: hypothetical protein ABI778_10765 [Ignavibacteriota bacterium]